MVKAKVIKTNTESFIEKAAYLQHFIFFVTYKCAQ
jgi:hypothetical protein